MKVLSLVITFIAATTFATAQTKKQKLEFSASINFRFEYFTTEQGLSENFIYTVFQDSKGYLWIGTHDGLNRFDGYRFVIYRQIPGDTNSLPNNTINAINEDDKGNIWIGTNNGLCILNPKLNTVKRVSIPVKDPMVLQILYAAKNEFLVRIAGRILRINTLTLDVNNVENDNANKEGFIFYNVSQFSTDKNGIIYTASNFKNYCSIWYYDTSSKFFKPYFRVPVEKILAERQARIFYKDKTDRLWLSLANTELIPLDTNKVKQQGVFANSSLREDINHLFEDKDFNLWVSTSDGLVLQNALGNSIETFRPSDEAGSISSGTVNSVYQDRTGILWIATINGLNKLNPATSQFRHITKRKSDYAALYDDFVLGIRSEPGNPISIFYNNPDNIVSVLSPDKKSIKHFHVRDYDTKKWILENCMLNPERLNDSLFGKLPLLLQSVRFNDLFKPGGKIFISDDGPWYIKGGIIFQLNTGKEWDLNSYQAEVKYYNDEIWIATQGNGLFCFDTKQKKVIAHYSGGTGRDSLNISDLYSIIIEETGDIWIGTKGGGLNFFNRQKKTFTNFTEKDGLCNNTIYCMAKDNNGNIWLGTTNGLSCFKPTTKIFRNYSRADGLINSEYNRSSACKLPDGSIMMGGMNGIDFSHPDNLAKTFSEFEVQITSFKVFDKNIYSDKVPQFHHNENVVTFEFAAMDYRNPVGNKFMYKLEGAEKEWVDAGYRNFTTYSNLSPGSYRFLVKALNSHGVLDETPAEYKFIILPAWYQTWWFLSLVVLAVASAIYILFRYRLQQKLKIYAVRQRLHRDLHDDVGATLSSVKAYSEILKDNPDNPVIAELIKDNSAEMIDRLEVIAWATNPVHDNFLSLKNKMTKYAVPLCYANKVDCSIEAAGINDELQVPGEIRQHIFLVFKEAVTNTIKYSEATDCNVKMYIQNRSFVMQVKDNGRGSDGTVRGSGNGWANMKKRAKELNGSVEIQSPQHKGTTIIFSIPFPFKIPNTWDRKDKYKG